MLPICDDKIGGSGVIQMYLNRWLKYTFDVWLNVHISILMKIKAKGIDESLK